MKDLTATLAFRDKFAYSTGSLGKEVAHGLISCYVFLYCIQVLELDIPFLGVLYLSHNLIGIITAPLLGIVLDNITCRFGKYKLLTFLGLLLNCATLLGFYYLPELTPSNIELTVTIIYLIWSMSFFMIDLPSWSILSAFNSSYATRDAMATVPCITNHLGTQMLVLCVLPFMQHASSIFDTLSYSLGALVAFYIMLISQSIFLFLLHNNAFHGTARPAAHPAPPAAHPVPTQPAARPAPAQSAAYPMPTQSAARPAQPAERLTPDSAAPIMLTHGAASSAEEEEEESATVGTSMARTPRLWEATAPRAWPETIPLGTPVATPHSVSHLRLKERLYTMAQVLIKNDQLMVIFLSTVLLYTAFGLMLGAYISFFIEHELLLAPSLYLILLGAGLLQLFAMASFETLVRHTSRTFIFSLALYMSMSGFALMFWAEYSSSYLFPLLAASIFLTNLGVGLCKVALTSMTIDTVDYGEFKLSVRTDGLIFSLRAMAHNLGQTISFCFYGGALTIGYILGAHNTLGLPADISAAVLIVLILQVVTLCLYLKFYKLNGAFYRNVLNNLQYLRQNQNVVSPSLHDQANNKFMLRYALDESTMLIKLNANNVDDVIKAMVQKLSEVQAITSEHDFMADLRARLTLGPCGIAEGIALPHAKSSAVRRATVVVATLDHPIDLGALDGRDCDLIFLLASPDDGYTHMNLLGRLSLLLNESGFADKLRASGSPTELFERMIQCERHIVR